jgi:anthranilate phosphoribosyltransferase
MMLALMRSGCDELQAAACLVALRTKGETAGEIAAAAAVLRERMLRWDPARPSVLDTCGTGGDGRGTFNISTAAAFVAAGAGVPVVKHGNRAVSGRTGSADVLSTLGIAIDCDAVQAKRSLDRCNLAFCFAPQFHPALRHVAALRRRLGMPTILNCLGPLANPAGAPNQLLGVGRPELVDVIAGALQRLGTRRTLVVCSHDGLDEVSLSASTRVCEVTSSGTRTWEWTPRDFGLAPCSLQDLRAEDADASARIIERVLTGEEGPATRVVLANAAAALLAAEKADTLTDAVAQAQVSLFEGHARRVLELLRSGQRSS